jgi:hypothetical protein
LVVVKIREILAVSKRPVNKINMDRLNLKKLNEGDVKEQFQVKIKNRFPALQNLEDDGASIGHWTLLEGISYFLPKSVSVIVK